MNFEEAKKQAIRTREYFPFRIVWIKEIDEGRSYEVYAKQQNTG